MPERSARALLPQRQPRVDIYYRAPHRGTENPADDDHPLAFGVDAGAPLVRTEWRWVRSGGDFWTADEIVLCKGSPAPPPHGGKTLKAGTSLEAATAICSGLLIGERHHSKAGQGRYIGMAGRFASFQCGEENGPGSRRHGRSAYNCSPTRLPAPCSEFWFGGFEVRGGRMAALASFGER